MKKIILPISILFTLFACQNSTINYQGFPKANHLNAQIEGFDVQKISDGTGEFLSINTDPQGRFLVSPRRGKLLRFEVINDATGTLKIDTLDVGVTDCQGLLYAYQSLYMMGTGPADIRGIYRLKDTNGQGNFGTPQLLKEFPRNGDHSGHTLALGKDGMIYFLTGNDNRPPTGENVAFVNQNWQTDQIDPVKTIFATSQKAPGGYVVRTDSVGSQWQLLSYGLRNPYDMAFSPEGELFTYDSDMEWDFNLPWYRPTRVNHLVSGGDYAWREGTAKRFDYYSDVWPSVVDFGRGSPTATLFGTDAAFPAKYQKALFCGDWSYGKIFALHLEENGASFTGVYENFISGQPLNITDMVVGKDGALYFTTGGNGTDTGLFRVIYTGKASTQKVAVNKSDNELIQLRRKLEAYHFSADTQGFKLAVKYMGHEDRFVRNAARVIIEKRAPENWINQLKNASGFDEEINYLTALIRVDSTQQYARLIANRLQTFDLRHLGEMEKLAVIRLYELYFVRNKQLSSNQISTAHAKLNAAFPADSELVNKELSRVLGFLASQTEDNQAFIEKTLLLIESTKNTELFVHYLSVLRRIKEGWSINQRLAWQYWLRYGQDNLSGGSLFGYFLGEIKREFDRTLSSSESRRLKTLTPKPMDADAEGPVPLKPKPATSVFASQPTNYNWTQEDLAYSLELVTSPRSGRIRDFNRGKQMFQKGQCYNCHYMYDKGGSFGPDLTTAGNSFTAEALLTAILEPSKDISSRFQSTKFTLKNEETVVGRIVSENADNYVLQFGFEPSSTEELYKREISRREPFDVSEMPKGLINSMNREEVLDLLYYIIELAGRNKGESKVTIHEANNVFLQGDSTLVELVDYSNQGIIYYTIDGSEPTTNSSQYDAPFYVTKSTQIKAISILEEIKSPVTTRTVHAVDTAVNGLNWQLYQNVDESVFPRLPTKQPNATGVAYTISAKNIAEGSNNFLVHYEGFLQIEQAGTYTFYTTQDDFAQLMIDNQIVVESRQSWFDADKTGQIKLTAGKHPISIKFYDHLAEEFLSIDYSSEKMERREISGDLLFRE
ncbi:MAG: FN3 associated domain-containing protein [Bacteroidota bacterium]